MIPISRPSIGLREIALVLESLTRNELSVGPRVKEFETKFARWLGVNHAVATTSGTTALTLALAALGIGPGDEVLVPDVTFVATAHAVCHVGAQPVLVDIDPESWNLNITDAEQHLTSRTKAIIPVHLYGAPCDMRDINLWANQRGLKVVEDAAEGLGARIGGDNVGTWSSAGCFSFYGNKIMTTGQGGMLVTDDDELAGFAHHLRNQALNPRGWDRYYHDMIGYNFEMTELQASLGVAQLERLDDMLAERWRVVDRYASQLPGWQHVRPGTVHAPWLFTIVHENPEGLANFLRYNDIEARPTFIPLHRLPMFRQDDAKYPVASQFRGLSLPTFPELTDRQVDHICAVVKAF